MSTKRTHLKNEKIGSGDKADLSNLIESELLKWIMKIRSNGIPITDRLIACKGRILRDQIDPSVNCKFSNGWL
jgi:hypothetical protein